MEGAELRVLIVDDEPLARRGLARQVGSLEGFAVVAECGNGRAAVEALQKGGLDLVLLDVEMPELDGFEVLAELGASDAPPVIFVTAFDKYAARAFEAHALDYLVKPVDPVRLGDALRRARAQLSAAHAEVRLEHLLADLAGRSEAPKCIAARASGRTLLLPLDEIVWVQAADNYVRLHFGGRIALHRATLTQLEERLDSKRFLRVHRSHIVQLSMVREWRAASRGDAELWLVGGTRLPVTKRYRGALEAALEQRT